MLLIILIVLLLCGAFGGLYGHSRWGAGSWSPLGIILVVCLILFLTGHFSPYLH